MNDKTYNGWANYETWLVMLWLDNEQTTYTKIRAIVKRNKGKEVYKIGDKIKEFVNSLPEIEAIYDKPSLACDLLGSALSEVDYREIAQSLVDEN